MNRKHAYLDEPVLGWCANRGSDLWSDHYDEDDAHDRAATLRDAAAARRDRKADRRDEFADSRDHTAVDHELSSGGIDISAAKLRKFALDDRNDSSADRDNSADDRTHSKADRERAASHRAASSIDELTGALHRHRWRHLFGDFDVVVCPITPTPAFAHDHSPDMLKRRLDIDGVARPYFDQLVWAGLATMPGLPATAVPAGQSPNGLPVGVQIIGPMYGDRTTLRLAGLLEQGIGGFRTPK